MKQPVSLALSLSLALACAGVSAADVGPVMLGAGECQIIDAVTEPIYEVGMTVAPESRFAGHGKSALIEFDARWDIAYFRDVLLAEMDFGLDFGSVLMTDSAGLRLPDVVTRLNVDAGLTWRYVAGTALQFRLKPGIYSDFEDFSFDALAMPCSAALVQSFHSGLSGILGVELRPDFETKIMPLVGFAWQPSDFVRLEAALPRSRLSCVFNDAWSGDLGFEWNNVSYHLDEKGEFDRERLEIEDYRFYAGLTKRISDALQLTGELGHVFKRQVEFRYATEDLPRKIDVDSAVYVRLALGGPF